MVQIASRVLLRFALVAASLAWAAFVFTNTIGDPGRGERIAEAVLDDPEARAEITAPITDAVLAATGLPASEEATVDAVVDRVLRDPAGAQAFVDPFAGSWARLLGEDDPRPAEFDLVSIVDDLDRFLEPLGIDTGLADEAVGDRELVVPSVPLPRTQLDWMRGVRRGVAGSVVPLALIALGLATAAFAAGERRRVARRVGVWAVAAGLLWVVVPPLLVWAARSWAPGADAVVAASLDEATSGLRLAALVLVTAGAAAVVASVLVPAPATRPEPAEPVWVPAESTVPATRPAAPSPASPATPITASAAAPTGRMPRVVTSAAPIAATMQQPAIDPSVDDRSGEGARGDADPETDSQALWDYYS